MINAPNTNASVKTPFTPRTLDKSSYTKGHNGAISIDSKFQVIKSNQIYFQTDTNNLWFNLNSNANLNSSNGWFKLQ